MARTISIDIDDHNAPGVCTSSYLVQYKISGDPSYSYVSTQYTSPIVIPGILDNTSYEISIQRECCDGNFGTALIINYNTLPLSDNITGLSLVPGASAIDIDWDDYTGRDDYSVYISGTNDIGTAKKIYTGTISTYSATGLEAATTYYVWVQARIGIQYSAFATDNTTTL